MHGLPLQDPRDPHHVLVAGVRAAADEHLVDFDRPDVLHGIHVIRHVRLRHQRLQGIQVDVHDLVVLRVRVRAQFGEIALPALGLQERPGHLVAGEHARRRAQLRAHVRDRRALGHGQGLHALADVFHHLADAALDAQPPQHLQDDVLRRHTVGQPAGEPDAHDLRAGQVVGPAAHRHGHVQAARPDGQHADAAAGGGVAVAAQQGHPGHAEALQMHLVADAVAGLRAEDPVLLRHALDILVVVRVLKPGLQGVVVDIGNALLRPHPPDAHGLKLQVGHRAGGVLRQGLVDPDGDLFPGLRGAADQVRVQDFVGKVHLHASDKKAGAAACGSTAAAPVFCIHYLPVIRKVNASAPKEHRKSSHSILAKPFYL